MDNNRKDDFVIQTQNRYGPLSERDIHNTPHPTEITRYDFVHSTFEEKLVHLFDEMRFIREDQVQSSLRMTNLNQVVSSLTEKVNRVIDASNAQNDFLKTVAYK